MKKLSIGLAMVLSLVLVANVAFTNESVPFPFWQHGWAIMSFFAVTNDGAAPATVTITMLNADGSLRQATTNSVTNGTAWQTDTATWSGWYTAGNGSGFGYYDITSAENATYLWGCCYALVTSAGGNSQPGYTVILPGNPYGQP